MPVETYDASIHEISIPTDRLSTGMDINISRRGLTSVLVLSSLLSAKWQDRYVLSSGDRYNMLHNSKKKKKITTHQASGSQP